MSTDETKSVRKERYNECKQLQIDDLMDNHQWALGIVFGFLFALFLTVAIASNNNPPVVSLIAIAATWFGLVGVPILIVHGIATYNCYPLLKYDNVDECEKTCKYWSCFDECIERAKTEKDREWCDNYCTQSYQSCIKRCNNAFKAGGTWH